MEPNTESEEYSEYEMYSSDYKLRCNHSNSSPDIPKIDVSLRRFQQAEFSVPERSGRDGDGIDDIWESNSARIMNAPTRLKDQYFSRLPNPTDAARQYNAHRQFLTDTISGTESEGSLINPNMLQIFYCLASIIQAQISDDYENMNDPEYVEYPEFNISFDALSPENGGDFEVIPEHILSREVDDDELRHRIVGNRVPLLYTVFRFLRYLYTGARYSPECNIMALVYINRLTSMNHMPLTVHNWRAIWLVTIMLAQKVWDDKPLRSSGFIMLLPTLELKDLRRMEYRTLHLMKFITGVKPSLYAKYYFELRQLYSDIAGRALAESWEPLTDLTRSKLHHKDLKAEELRLKHLSHSSYGGGKEVSHAMEFRGKPQAPAPPKVGGEIGVNDSSPYSTGSKDSTPCSGDAYRPRG